MKTAAAVVALALVAFFACENFGATPAATTAENLMGIAGTFGEGLSPWVPSGDVTITPSFHDSDSCAVLQAGANITIEREVDRLAGLYGKFWFYTAGGAAFTMDVLSAQGEVLVTHRGIGFGYFEDVYEFPDGAATIQLEVSAGELDSVAVDGFGLAWEPSPPPPPPPPRDTLSDHGDFEQWYGDTLPVGWMKSAKTANVQPFEGGVKLKAAVLWQGHIRLSGAEHVTFVFSTYGPIEAKLKFNDANSPPFITTGEKRKRWVDWSKTYVVPQGATEATITFKAGNGWSAVDDAWLLRAK